MTNINCVHNKRLLCTNPKVKKRLYGFGDRLCTEYPVRSKNGCKYKILFERKGL